MSTCEDCNGAGGWCSICGQSPDNCDCGDCERNHWTECLGCDGHGVVDEEEEEGEESMHQTSDHQRNQDNASKILDLPRALAIEVVTGLIELMQYQVSSNQRDVHLRSYTQPAQDIIRTVDSGPDPQGRL